MYVTAHMTTPPITVSSDEQIVHVKKLLKEKHFRHVPIVDEFGVLLGMVTDRDIRSAYPSSMVHDDDHDRETQKIDKTPVREIMSRDIVSLNEFSTIDDALILLDGKKVGAMPVVDDSRTVLGIFSIRDMITAYSKLFGLGERGSALVAVRPDGDKRPLTRISHVLEEHDIHFSRLIRVKDEKSKGVETIYIRVNTMNIQAVHTALEDAGFEINLLKPND